MLEHLRVVVRPRFGVAVRGGRGIERVDDADRHAAVPAPRHPRGRPQADLSVAESDHGVPMESIGCAPQSPLPET